MNIKKIQNFYNPDTVYQGFFETYLIRPFVHHYVDFSGRESGVSCVLSLAAWLILTLGIFGVLTGLVGLLGPDVGFTALKIVGILWLLTSVAPLLALFARTAHGAGDRKKEPVAKMLGIDWMLTAISLCFFICGTLMMTTTLHSETLHPNAGYVEEEETDSIYGERVIEEPIFTYQDQAPAPADTTVTDTLGIEEDPDLLAPYESFDPTIETEAVTDTAAYSY